MCKGGEKKNKKKKGKKKRSQLAQQELHADEGSFALGVQGGRK